MDKARQKGIWARIVVLGYQISLGLSLSLNIINGQKMALGLGALGLFLTN